MLSSYTCTLHCMISHDNIILWKEKWEIMCASNIYDESMNLVQWKNVNVTIFMSTFKISNFTSFRRSMRRCGQNADCRVQVQATYPNVACHRQVISFQDVILTVKQISNSTNLELDSYSCIGPPAGYLEMSVSNDWVFLGDYQRVVVTMWRAVSDMTCDLWPLLESFLLWLAVNVWIFHKSWFFARRPALDGEFWSPAMI